VSSSAEDKDKLIASLESQLKTAHLQEYRLKTLIQSAPLCIHEINLQGQITSMNKAGLSMMDMINEREICGVYYMDFVNKEQKFTINKLLIKAFMGEYNSFEFSPENSSLIFTSCFAPVFNDEGEVDRVMGITEDITLQRKNEEELLKSRKLESIGLLAGGIAHDFNNILTGMFGHLELAKLKLNNKHPVFEHINTANQVMGDAAKLSNQLLTFAKGGDPVLEVLDLPPIIEDSITLLLAGSNVTTSLNIATELWQLNADNGQLSQVITNLVINAKQAMPEGGTLTIEAFNSKNYHNSAAPWLTGNVVCLKIIDQGLGIAEDLKAHIFDPYFTTKQGGSGLGLATVYSIIKKHKGFIEVDSITGKGASFNLYLPANIEKKAVQNRNSNTQVSKANAAYKILLMDDEKMILDIAKEMLSILGYEVDTALNGHQAIMKYENSLKSDAPYDVVVMDLTIPGGHGGESVIKELLLLNPEIKAIVTSGYSTGQVMAYPQNFGFKERLIKPFNMNTLEKTLNKLLTE
jgi:signal transduction histidine kinase/ActR/RegA family two-component response regulator